MTDKNKALDSTTTIDPQRMKIALAMVSDLLGGPIPKPGTNITTWTSQINLQIAWSANLNNSSRPSQFSYGWTQVYASEIAGCTFIEDLIGLVYSKLRSSTPPPPIFESHIEDYAALFTTAKAKETRQ